MACCGKTRSFLLRVLNILIGLVGLGLLGYGIYMLKKELDGDASNHVLSGIVMSVGAATALLCLSMATCGHRSICWLNFYLFAYFFLELFECVVAGLTLNTRAREKIIDGMHPSDSLRNFLHNNAKTCGYIVVAVIAAQFLAILFAVCQRSALIDAGFDSDADSDVETGAARNRTLALLGDDKRNGRERYREKNKDMYAKYGR